MTRRLGVALAVGVALALCGCQRLSPKDQRTVQRYLLCEECTEGEEAAVLQLGTQGEAALGEAINGPPADRLENMRLQAEAMYDRIPNPRTSRQQYLDHYLGNYRSVYQKRAAKGLRLFATPTAHATLIGAVRGDSLYREDVRRAFGAAAGVAASLTAGDGQDGATDSLLKVMPTVKVVDTTTGQPLAQVRVEFRVDSGGGTVLDTIRYTDANGVASARWQLGPTETVNALSAVAAGQVVRFQASAHAMGARVVILVQPSNGTKGQPITPPVRFAVHDAWGALQPSVASSADVRVIPLSVTAVVPIINGVGEMTAFSVPQAGTGLRLRVSVIGAQTAVSEPFDVAP